VSRDIEYGYDTLIENVVDPAHVPFSHHGVQAKRQQSVPLNISVGRQSTLPCLFSWSVPLNISVGGQLCWVERFFSSVSFGLSRSTSQ
jgi:phenylpropionate dioxygenase-like ring-hydroxylating dioxygenase large terminal subunit